MGSSFGMTGPLAAFAPGFAVELVARGYRSGSTAALLELTADVSAWLAVCHNDPPEVARLAERPDHDRGLFVSVHHN